VQEETAAQIYARSTNLKTVYWKHLAATDVAVEVLQGPSRQHLACRLRQADDYAAAACCDQRSNPRHTPDRAAAARRQSCETWDSAREQNSTSCESMSIPASTPQPFNLVKPYSGAEVNYACIAAGLSVDIRKICPASEAGESRKTRQVRNDYVHAHAPTRQDGDGVLRHPWNTRDCAAGRFIVAALGAPLAGLLRCLLRSNVCRCELWRAVAGLSATRSQVIGIDVVCV
jgi:hypothetical protein